MRLAALIAAVVVMAAAAAFLAGDELERTDHGVGGLPAGADKLEVVLRRDRAEAGRAVPRTQHPRLVRARWLTSRLGQPRRVVWLTPLLARWRYGTTLR
jgi:hypothetical protein